MLRREWGPIQLITTYETSRAKRSRNRKRLERFIALKTKKKHVNPGCIGFLTDIADFRDSRDVTNYSEPSDEHQMGAHQKSLRKPS